MAKILKVKFPQKCIGCELCVAEIQRQLGVIGLEGSLIRVLKKSNAVDNENFIFSTDPNYQEEESLTYILEVDPNINNYSIEDVKNICPTGVFTIEEGSPEDDLLS